MDISLLSIEEALQFAMSEELEASKLYKKMGEKVKNQNSKAMFAELEKQEKIHYALLENFNKESTREKLDKKIPKESSGIAEMLVTTHLDENTTSQEALIFAMKEEEKAVKLYTYLKNIHEGTDSEELFARLVNEEMRHKVRLEEEYEKEFLSEN
ncbi:ferritin family protein [candidate division KSB1 bacterium]